MAIYGLSVFLETPKPERKGRVLYIVLSFIIMTLSAFCTALNTALIYHNLLEARSGIGFILVVQRDMASGLPLLILSNCSLRFLVMIGDALMVSL